MNADTPAGTDVVGALSQLKVWQTFLLTSLFAGVGALLKVLVRSVRGKFWRGAVRVLSSAFWGGMGAVLLSEWLAATPKTLLVIATLLGWAGYENTVGMLMKLLEQKIGPKKNADGA